MALLGKTAVVIYSNYPPEYREEHCRFHSYEHLLERVSTKGFLRGRRLNALDAASPSAFALYEVADKSVTVQGEYIDKLNNPTPWTQKFRPLADYASRTLCEVVASAGLGTGSRAMTVRFSPQAGREDELKAWLLQTVSGEFASSESRVGAHFLVRDRSIERPMTEEERICARGAGSVESDWILLIEGWDENALRDLKRGILGETSLASRGARPGVTFDFYALSHVLSHEEMVRSATVGVPR